MASYPSAVKSFASRSAAQTIASAHVNDLQDEVNAIEAGLLNGLAHNLTISTGGLTVSTGATTLGGSLSVAGGSTFAGAVTFSGAVSGVESALVCEGRLTLESGVPVSTSDQSAKTSAYFTPYGGNRIGLYDGSAWKIRTFAELTISLAGLTASMPYDVFAYDNAGTVTIETLIWTNTTTRATALTTQNGVLVKTGATTRRYIGTIYINATGGQTDDTQAKRYVYSHDKSETRPLGKREATASWNYTTATIRQARADATNQVEVMVGWPSRAIDLHLVASAGNATADVEVMAAIGLDSTSAVSSACLFSNGRTVGGNDGFNLALHAVYREAIAVGWHRLVWLEYSGATGTTVWKGVSAGAYQTGLAGTWKC